MTRVAFIAIGGKRWTGGYHYLLNLARVCAQDGRLTPVVFFGDDVGGDDVAPFASLLGVETVRSPLFDEARKRSSLARALLLGRDPEVARLFHQRRIDVVFESAHFFGWRLGLPALAWLPDFQHRHLSGLFPRGAWWRREIGFRAQVWSGRRIMLSSDDAVRDCLRFYPSTRGRTCAVRFAVPPPAPMSQAQARAVAADYGLPQHFFYLPNQFWSHKNHLLVLDALALLRDRGCRFTVAASGLQADARDPSYFPRVVARMRDLGLEDSFRLLGLVPYAHLGALMRACAALINPSRFEGWSTTVEEARSLGVPLILSDLPVHREQAGGSARYFDVHSATALADALVSFEPLDDVSRAAVTVAAAHDAALRLQRFADDFVLAVSSVHAANGGGARRHRPARKPIDGRA